MSDYISREAAIEAMYKDAEEHQDHTFWATQHEALRNIPAADVRPVVRCKDCDCCNTWDSAGRKSLGNFVCSCAYWSVEDGPVLYTKPDAFCSYGEKIEEEQT